MDLLRGALLRLVKRAPLFLAVALLTLAFLVAVTVFMEPPREHVQAIEEAVRRLGGIHEECSRGVDRCTVAIFFNNAVANLLFAVPFFINVYFYLSVMTTTAWALRIAVRGIPGGAEAAALLLATLPHTYVELLAYSITLTTSLALTVNLLKGRRDRGRLVEYALGLALSFVILLLAALIEALTLPTVRR